MTWVWGFQSQNTLSSDWVVTATARPHAHLHCIFQNLQAQKGTIKEPTKQMRFSYITQACNHISHVVSFPICYVLTKVEPESWSRIRRVGWGGSGGGGGGHGATWCRPPSVSSAYREVFCSRWDISFSASANNITGGNALGDVLQALIPFVS